MASYFLIVSILLAQIPQMLLPDGNGAWVVQVVSSGGLLGTGSGDFATSSEGKIVCNPDLRCPKDFAASDFLSLVEAIQPSTPQVPALPAVSLCNDCIKRTITISRRDSMGVVRTYTASWDETTKSRVPQEVIRIYDAFVALVK
jgi:hypothetical protein